MNDRTSDVPLASKLVAKPLRVGDADYAAGGRPANGTSVVRRPVHRELYTQSIMTTLLDTWIARANREEL